MIDKLDIVHLIENNPLIKLSKTYQCKILQKIQQCFTQIQQKLFVSSFYCYLNYNSKADFVIELESIWKWLGFSRKDPVKVLLLKHFKQDIDYKIIKAATEVARVGSKNLASEVAEASLKKQHGGQNKEKIVMTINTFKKICLKSNTKKADEIHDYFIKLEELLQEVITEESNELKQQLQIKDIIIQQKDQQFILDTEQVLLQSYNKKSIVYLIFIYENLWKFGFTNNIFVRLNEHRRDINKNIKLIWCIESNDNIFLEKELKEYLQNTNYRKEKIFKKHIQTELIEIDDILIIQNKLIEINKYIEMDKNVKFKTLEDLKNKNKKLTEENKELKLQLKIQNSKKITISLTNTLPCVHPIQTKNRNVKEKFNSEEEKLKFLNWIEKHIEKTDENCVLNWIDILTKFLGYRTSPLISKQIRLYFEEYIKNTFPDIDFVYKGINFQKNKYNGWKNLICNI